MDSSSIVYSAAPGSLHSAEELYLVKAAGGAPLKLHAAKGYLHILSTGK